MKFRRTEKGIVTERGDFINKKCISVYHWRDVIKPDGVAHSFKNTLSPYGGRTLVCINIGNRVIRGETRCSKKDRYDRKRGYTIALGRALEKFYELVDKGELIGEVE